jgi:hypothetical protein
MEWIKLVLLQAIKLLWNFDNPLAYQINDFPIDNGFKVRSSDIFLIFNTDNSYNTSSLIWFGFPFPYLIISYSFLINSSLSLIISSFSKLISSSSWLILT